MSFDLVRYHILYYFIPNCVMFMIDYFLFINASCLYLENVSQMIEREGIYEHHRFQISIQNFIEKILRIQNDELHD